MEHVKFYNSLSGVEWTYPFWQTSSKQQQQQQQQGSSKHMRNGGKSKLCCGGLDSAKDLVGVTQQGIQRVPSLT